MSVLCPRCGESNSQSSGICQECGFAISLTISNEENRSAPADMKTIIVGDDKVKFLSCVECNYPLRNDANNCPNCGREIMPSKVIDEDISPFVEGVNIDKSTTKNQEAMEAEEKSKTIIQNYESVKNSQASSSGPQTVLQPNISSEESQPLAPESYESLPTLVRLSSISLNNEDGCDDINISTSDRKLGRDDIDSADNTISKKHIRVFKEGDTWFIENQASNKATFFVVDGKHPINDGDLVLIGNSKFFRIEIL